MGAPPEDSTIRIDTDEFRRDPQKYVSRSKNGIQVVVEEGDVRPTILGVGEPAFELEVEGPDFDQDDSSWVD